MSAKSGISYCDRTWEPVVGCTRQSPGCDRCWSLALAWRFSHNPNAKMQATYGGLTRRARVTGEPEWSGVVRCLPERLDEPLTWRTPQRVFVVSQADLFHEAVPFDFIERVFAVMWACKMHTFLLLTKRPQRMLEFYAHYQKTQRIFVLWPLPNVWVGVTVEDQTRADERIPLLLQVPAAVRWVSVEPMLGPVDLSGYLHPSSHLTDGLWHDDCPACLRRRVHGGTGALDWAVCGCESGPGARLMDASWAYSLWTQVHDAGLPFWFKQAMVDGKLDHQPTILGRTWQEVPDA